MIKKDGLVALQQYSANNISRKVEVEGVIYESNLKNNVILMWVPETVAEKILNSPNNMTKGCNCPNAGALKPLFYYASQTNVNIHETGQP